MLAGTAPTLASGAGVGAHGRLAGRSAPDASQEPRLVTERARRFRAVTEALPILATMITVLIALSSSLQAQAQYRGPPAAARFQSAVERLAGPDLTTRVGGIALLGQVAQGGTERREVATRFLATYLRVNRPVTPAGKRAPVTEQPAAEEVRAVFAALQFRGDVSGIVLGRIRTRNLMFSGTDLTGLIFSRSDLSGSLFEGADFNGASGLASATLRHDHRRHDHIPGGNERSGGRHPHAAGGAVKHSRPCAGLPDPVLA